MAHTLILPPTQTITVITAKVLWGHIETLSRGDDISDSVSINSIEAFFGDVTAPRFRRAIYSGHIYTVTNSTSVPIAWRLTYKTSASSIINYNYGIIEPGSYAEYSYASSDTYIDFTPYFSFTCRLA